VKNLDIYPDIWDESSITLKDDIRDCFNGLKAFYNQALANECAVIVNIG
jgi:hypothetical protein